MTEYAWYDLESRSQADLKKVGTYRYAAHPSTEIQCVAWGLDDEPIQLWRPGDPLPKRLFKHITKGGKMVAHGAQFEIQMHRRKLGPLYGWPVPEIPQYRCTSAMASALALPASLEDLAEALGLEVGKDKVGKRVMLQMTKPRKARKGEDPDKVYWHEDDVRAQQLYAYCIQDVVVTRDCFDLMWQLTPFEQAVWEMDQRINDRGFYVDPDLLLAMRRIITDAGADIDKQIKAKTKGAVNTVNEVAGIKTWFKSEFDMDIDSLNKQTIPVMLADPDVPQLAKDVLELRLAGAQAAVKKVDAFLSRRDANTGRIQGAFVYHAAGTGRWASRGAQVHNLKRLTSEDQDQIASAVDDLMSGDYQTVKVKYNRPLQIVGDNIRTAICAAPGNVLIGADYSGIEARVTAWVAGELRKIKVFQDYDAGRGPDPYVAAAADCFGLSVADMVKLKTTNPPEYKIKRQGGKGAELAFGFQGGVNAYVKFVPAGLFTLEQIDGFKVKWRNAHPNIKGMWDSLKWESDRIAKHASHVIKGMTDPDYEPVQIRNLTMSYEDGYMFLYLPSGRRISYPGISRMMRYREQFNIQRPEDFDPSTGSLASYFMDNSGGRFHRVFLYGGIIMENLVQGIARDLLAAAMLRIEKAGLPLVAHIHDECVIEVAKKGAEKAMALFVKLMEELPPWAVTPECPLPVKANGWMAERYVK